MLELNPSQRSVGVLGLLLLIPCFQLGSGLYGDYSPMNKAGLRMLHDMYRDTGNTTGFWEAVLDYQSSSTYRLVCFFLMLSSVQGCKYDWLRPCGV